MAKIVAVEDRLRAWQERHDLTADGDLGPTSMTKMEAVDRERDALELEVVRLEQIIEEGGPGVVLPPSREPIEVFLGGLVAGAFIVLLVTFGFA